VGGVGGGGLTEGEKPPVVQPREPYNPAILHPKIRQSLSPNPKSMNNDSACLQLLSLAEYKLEICVPSHLLRQYNIKKQGVSDVTFDLDEKQTDY
jgi:hypothetical protein